MAGGKGYTFSSDNEEEMNEWISAFQAALKKDHNDQENHQNDEALDKGNHHQNHLYGWSCSPLRIVLINKDTTASDVILITDSDVSLTAEPPPPTYGTLKGLEHSMNPLLMRYSRETDLSIAAARSECRTNIFNLPYKRAPSPEPQLEPFK